MAPKNIFYTRLTMNFSTGTKVIIFIVSFLMFAAVCEAQRPGPGIRIPQEKTNDRAPKNGKVKVKKFSPEKAKKQQEAKKKKQDKEWDEYIKENRKHALEIQTPEVRERMKGNRKDSDTKYRIKRKKVSEGSKRAERKYN